MRVPRFRLGKALISLVAVETAVGPFRYDWNDTHIHNPAWPPHAKFHNGQTMSLGATLSAAALWQLWTRSDDPRQALDAAAVFAALYWITNISAIFYPGSRAVDPPGSAVFPQWKFALPSLALVGVGHALERRHLDRSVLR